MPALLLWEDTTGQTVVNATHPLPVNIVAGGSSGTSDTNLVSIGGVTASVNNGASDNGTLRVTLANDSTGVLASIGSITSPVAVTQSTSPWVVSGTVAVSSVGGTVVADTELPTAVTLADDISPSSAPYIGSFLYGYQVSGDNWDRLRITGDNSDALGTATTGHLQVLSHNMIYNGTTWDRARGSITDGLLVNLGANNDVTVTGTVTANQGGSWTVAVSSVSGTVAVTQSTSPWVVSGTVAATQSGTWTIQPGNTANTTPWLVSSKTALTASSPTAATVGTSTGLAVAANASRKGLVLINTSNNTISLGIGASAILLSGITLSSGGGTWVMDEFTFTTGAINAIASGASSNLAIQEFT